MTKTFRQTVEEILSSTECEHDGRICSDMTLDKYEERPSCEQCRTDRICSAVLKMAEGMPDLSKTGDWSKIVTEQEQLLAEILRVGARHQYKNNQDYWRKQVE